MGPAAGWTRIFIVVYTDIVRGLIEALGGKPVILAGMSLEGGICLNMALTCPEPIKILVPVDAWGLFGKLPWHRLTYWFIRSKLNDNLYAWTNSSSIVISSLQYSLFGDKSKVGDALVAEVQKAMLELGAGRPFASFQRSEITPTGFTTPIAGYYALAVTDERGIWS